MVSSGVFVQPKPGLTLPGPKALPVRPSTFLKHEVRFLIYKYLFLLSCSLDAIQAMVNNTSRITRSSIKKKQLSTEMVNDSDGDQQGYVLSLP